MYSPPPYVQPGAVVGLAATAKAVPQGSLVAAKKLLEQNGLRWREASNLYQKDGLFAGSDAARLEGLNELLQAEDVAAIWLARGGYGSTRLLQGIDWASLAEKPKWLMGFSDVTALLSGTLKAGLQSLHGPVAAQVASHVADCQLLMNSILGKGLPELEGETVPSMSAEVNAPLVGGNLSMLCSLLGTPYMPQTKGAIVLLEEVGEPLYRIDRYLWQLRLAGVFEGMAGLVIGDISYEPNEPPFERSIPQMFSEVLAVVQCPVTWGLPVGHAARNVPVAIGARYGLRLADGHAWLRPEKALT